MNRLATHSFLLFVAIVASSPIGAQEQTAPTSAFDFTSSGFWETASGKPIGNDWEFSEGEIRLTKPRGGTGNLVSKPLPANFELSFEWNIAQGTNTGLKYRVRRFGKHMLGNSLLGVEYQIIDDDAKNPTKGSTASIYDLVAPNDISSMKPAGSWNSAKIVADGNRLEHYLNGKLVASAVTTGPQWDKSVAFSKFYGAEDFARPATGDRIMLTDHGGKAAFRKFRFVAKALTKTKSNATTQSAPQLGNAMRNSWADQDSIVIWTRTTARAEMLTEGTKFITLSTKEANALSTQRDSAALMAAQIPQGKRLSEMFGASPGVAGQVRLSYFPGKQRSEVKSTDWIKTEAETDFTAQWELDDLRPNTLYAAIIEATTIDGSLTTAVVRGSFRTAPEPTAAEDINFCVTTCHDFIRRDDGLQGHKIYPAMTKMKPHFIVHAGDIEYYDKPDPWAMTEELMRFKWGRIFSLPTNRDFYSRTTSYFLKDDHDTLKNDCWTGQMYGSVSFERGVEIFNNEQFPSLAPRYTTVHWGRDLQVWFLEGRDYRSPNNMQDGPDKSILGKQQKEWLFQTLGSSTAKFKLIFSPTPIVGPDRKNKKDNHANQIFQHEGDEMRNRLSRIDGAIVLCGDRHWQYASFDPEANLWEFGCGPGSEKHQLGWKKGDERPLHRFLRVKGGFLTGEVKYKGDDETPQLTLRHRTVTGEPVSQFRFPTE